MSDTVVPLRGDVEYLQWWHYLMAVIAIVLCGLVQASISNNCFQSLLYSCLKFENSFLLWNNVIPTFKRKIVCCQSAIGLFKQCSDAGLLHFRPGYSWTIISGSSEWCKSRRNILETSFVDRLAIYRYVDRYHFPFFPNI